MSAVTLTLSLDRFGDVGEVLAPLADRFKIIGDTAFLGTEHGQIRDGAGEVVGHWSVT